MYRLYVNKLNMPEILEKLSTKYRVSKRTLYTDWQKRTQWVYAVFDLEPAQAS
jgi:N-acetyl-gamma-glutamylphosphate reductase